MENSKLKDKLKKEDTNQALKFVKEHARYFAAGALFFVLVLVLVKCAVPGANGAGENMAATEITEETEEAYQIDAYQEVNDLIARYYTAYAAGDVTALTELATPVSANEQSYITLFSQYVDEYQNIKCYTKSGLDVSAYLVSVSMEIKFAGVDTTAPGLDFFYVRTKEDGTLYIDNLYSQYNLANQENALDTSVQSLINEFEKESDVVTLQNEVQTKYDAAVASDENLATMINTTIPNAITEWVTQVAAENAQTETEGTEQIPEETEAPEETETQEEPTEQTPEEEPEVVSESVYTTDTVNVRAAADTSAEKLGSLEKGTQIARTGTEGDWSIVDYGGTTGYIKSEYLSTEAPGLSETDDDESESGTGINIAEGTEIILKNAVNIRSGMSETSEKVGTAYTGEKVTVIMSYADGWTKVDWNGKTGYIKSSLLQ